jgi:hypothetical protein
MIDGYADLLDLRRDGLRPAGYVLITDSEVIEFSWSELLREYPAQPGQVPPCSVLRIRNEGPHDLTALRGLPVISMLARKSSEPWSAKIDAAKPVSHVFFRGLDAIQSAAELADEYFDRWMEGA